MKGDTSAAVPLQDPAGRMNRPRQMVVVRVSSTESRAESLGEIRVAVAGTVAHRATWLRSAVVRTIVVVIALVAAWARPAWAATPEPYVKYYVVLPAYEDGHETLTGIASRLLGSPARAADIFKLNEGRKQPDGGALTDPDSLRPGWLLVLPWDAFGPGVAYGLLPTQLPVVPDPPVSAGEVVPAESGVEAPSMEAPDSPAPASEQANGCAPVNKVSPEQPTPWAQLRLGADQAWAYTRGEGVIVGVLDSGVEGARPELTGRVMAGADIMSGTARGNTDCLGTGTAMAGLIAAQPGMGASSIFGVAPGAMIMPVKLATHERSASTNDQANAIDVAVSSGATVLAMGSFVDVNDPKVAEAIDRAVEHDVVIVVAAGGDKPVTARPAVIRAGGIDADGGLATQYAAGGVDVVAPGVNVASLSIGGDGQQTSSGTAYAVALVAGTAALLRSMNPDLSAEQVVDRIKSTADRMGDGTDTAADPAYGWGLINVMSALEAARPGDNPDDGQAPSTAGGGWTGLIVILIGLALGSLLVVRIRRVMRSRRATPQRTDESTYDDEADDQAYDWRQHSPR